MKTVTNERGHKTRPRIFHSNRKAKKPLQGVFSFRKVTYLHFPHLCHNLQAIDIMRKTDSLAKATVVNYSRSTCLYTYGISRMRTGMRIRPPEWVYNLPNPWMRTSMRIRPPGCVAIFRRTKLKASIRLHADKNLLRKSSASRIWKKPRMNGGIKHACVFYTNNPHRCYTYCSQYVIHKKVNIRK